MGSSSVRLSIVGSGSRWFDWKKCEGIYLSGGQQRAVKSFLLCKAVQVRELTYRSEILLVERWSLYCDFYVVKYFCFPGKSIERGWKGLLHVVVRVSCHVKPQGIEAIKQGVVIGAVIVKWELTLISGPAKPF